MKNDISDDLNIGQLADDNKLIFEIKIDNSHIIANAESLGIFDCKSELMFWIWNQIIIDSNELDKYKKIYKHEYNMYNSALKIKKNKIKTFFDDMLKNKINKKWFVVQQDDAMEIFVITSIHRSI